MRTTDQRRPKKPFFIEILNFWPWPGQKNRQINFGAFGCVFYQPLFLQKTKPLYPQTKYLFGPQRIRNLAIVCPQSVFVINPIKPHKQAWQCKTLIKIFWTTPTSFPNLQLWEERIDNFNRAKMSLRVPSDFPELDFLWSRPSIQVPVEDPLSF